MTVYAVSTGEYSSYGVCAIFSTREKAEEYSLTVSNFNDIEEYELDEPYEQPEFIEVLIGPNYIELRGSWGPWLTEGMTSMYSGYTTVKVKYNKNADVMKKSAYDRLAELKAKDAGIV